MSDEKAKPGRIRVDSVFLAQFRDHVGKAECGCNLDGPAKDCDIGEALYRCAYRRPIAEAA